jgi:hypothetical protein
LASASVGVEHLYFPIGIARLPQWRKKKSLTEKRTQTLSLGKKLPNGPGTQPDSDGTHKKAIVLAPR